MCNMLGEVQMVPLSTALLSYSRCCPLGWPRGTRGNWGLQAQERRLSTTSKISVEWSKSSTWGIRTKPVGQLSYCPPRPADLQKFTRQSQHEQEAPLETRTKLGLNSNSNLLPQMCSKDFGYVLTKARNGRLCKTSTAWYRTGMRLEPKKYSNRTRWSVPDALSMCAEMQRVPENAVYAQMTRTLTHASALLVLEFTRTTVPVRGSNLTGTVFQKSTFWMLQRIYFRACFENMMVSLPILDSNLISTARKNYRSRADGSVCSNSCELQ